MGAKPLRLKQMNSMGGFAYKKELRINPCARAQGLTRQWYCL